MDAKTPAVLVVEDDPDLRGALADLLDAEGFRVIEAEDGFAALVALDHQDISLMVLDYWMPHFNGREVLAYLDALGEHLPVVMLLGGPNRPSICREGTRRGLVAQAR